MSRNHLDELVGICMSTIGYVLVCMGLSRGLRLL